MSRPNTPSIISPRLPPSTVPFNSPPLISLPPMPMSVKPKLPDPDSDEELSQRYEFINLTKIYIEIFRKFEKREDTKEKKENTEENTEENTGGKKKEEIIATLKASNLIRIISHLFSELSETTEATKFKDKKFQDKGFNDIKDEYKLRTLLSKPWFDTLNKAKDSESSDIIIQRALSAAGYTELGEKEQLLLSNKELSEE
jgi:hypothetical protein